MCTNKHLTFHIMYVKDVINKSNSMQTANSLGKAVLKCGTRITIKERGPLLYSPLLSSDFNFNLKKCTILRNVLIFSKNS